MSLPVNISGVTNVRFPNDPKYGPYGDRRMDVRYSFDESGLKTKPELTVAGLEFIAKTLGVRSPFNN